MARQVTARSAARAPRRQGRSGPELIECSLELAEQADNALSYLFACSAQGLDGGRVRLTFAQRRPRP
jgi:hypothetical protein